MRIHSRKLTAAALLLVLAGPNILIAGAPGKVSVADKIKVEKALAASAIRRL